MPCVPLTSAFCGAEIWHVDDSCEKPECQFTNSEASQLPSCLCMSRAFRCRPFSYLDGHYLFGNNVSRHSNPRRPCLLTLEMLVKNASFSSLRLDAGIMSEPKHALQIIMGAQCWDKSDRMPHRGGRRLANMRLPPPSTYNIVVWMSILSDEDESQTGSLLLGVFYFQQTF